MREIAECHDNFAHGTPFGGAHLLPEWMAPKNKRGPKNLAKNRLKSELGNKLEIKFTNDIGDRTH